MQMPAWVQALLIVVGNPAVLMHDPNWRAFMQQCQLHGAVAGQPMPDLHLMSGSSTAAGSSSSSGMQEMSELERLMASLSLGRAAEAAAGDNELFGFSGLVGQHGAARVIHGIASSVFGLSGCMGKLM